MGCAADETMLVVGTPGTDLGALRPLLASTFGIDSAQVRNLDKQISRLRSA